MLETQASLPPLRHPREPGRVVRWGGWVGTGASLLLEAPQLGLRVFAREVSPSVTPGGQICRLVVASACGEPGPKHSGGQILGQDPWAPHLHTTRKPCLQLPASPAWLPDLPPHNLQPPPKRFTGDTHLHQPRPAQQHRDQGSPQPGRSDGSGVLPLSSAPPAPQQGLPLPPQPPGPRRQGGQPTCPCPTPALFTQRILASAHPAG